MDHPMDPVYGAPLIFFFHVRPLVFRISSPFSSPEAALLLVTTKNRDLFHTTGHSREHARDLSTSSQFPSSSHKIPRSTSATRAISALSSIILPLQTFFSRVLVLRQQPFSSENLPPERPTTTTAIKTQVLMFRYESVNSTRKFTIVAEIVSLLKKIYKRDAPFRAVFKVNEIYFPRINDFM